MCDALPPVTTTNDVFDARLTDKMSCIAITDIELAETVKQIRPLIRSGAARDVEDSALLCDDRAQGSIRRDSGRHLGVTACENHTEYESTEDACSPAETTHSSVSPAVNGHNVSFMRKDRLSGCKHAPSYHSVVKRTPQLTRLRKPRYSPARDVIRWLSRPKEPIFPNRRTVRILFPIKKLSVP